MAGEEWLEVGAVGRGETEMILRVAMDEETDDAVAKGAVAVIEDEGAALKIQFQIFHLHFSFVNHSAFADGGVDFAAHGPAVEGGVL